MKYEITTTGEIIITRKLNNHPKATITILMALYLFLALTVVVKIKRPSKTNQIMNKPICITHPLIKIANRALIDLATPTNITA
jgi:hypothetical protein